MSHPQPTPDPSPEPAAIFARAGERLVPSLFAQGPWNPEHLHGGPICGVLARAIEACESPAAMRVARMTAPRASSRPRGGRSTCSERSGLIDVKREWIGLRARSGIEPDGIGQSAATLFDSEGVVARALVSLLVERRPGGG